MGEALMIPVDAIADVRDGLLLEMGGAIDDLDQLLCRRDRERHREWFELVRGRLRSLFALIDVVGWEPAGGGDVVVDLAEHGRLVKGAIEMQLAALRALLEEVELSDAWRARRGLPPRRQELTERERGVRHLIGRLDQGLWRAEL